MKPWNRKIDHNRDGRMARPGDKFALGRVLISDGAIAADEPNEAAAAIRCHAEGEWGALDAEDRAANDRALKTGGRLLSRYMTTNGNTYLVITEADRSTTTVLLPEEY